MYYIGIYNNAAYCISESKYSIISYMQYLRGLNKCEYYINIADEDILNYDNNDDLYIEKLYGEYYLPRRDIRWITRDTNDIEKTFVNILDGLRYIDSILFFMKNTKHCARIENISSYLEKLKSSKLSSIQKGVALYNPIIFASMSEYNEMIKTLSCIDELDNEFKNKIK